MAKGSTVKAKASDASNRTVHHASATSNGENADAETVSQVLGIFAKSKFARKNIDSEAIINRVTANLAHGGVK